jgi:hypothetical protein
MSDDGSIGIAVQARNATQSIASGTALNTSPEWTYGTDTAPMFGGRVHMRRTLNARFLARLATVSDVQGTISGLSDVTEADALFGSSALSLVTTGATLVTLAPAVVAPTSVNVTAGNIRFWLKPVLNMFANMDRFSVELHSAGTPASPTANFHTIDLAGGNGPSWLRGRLTSQNGLGRWQAVGIPVGKFVATGNGADLTQIIFARILLRSSSGNSLTVRIGGIDFVPNALTKAKCILSFDDAYATQATVVAPLMAKYGFRGVLYPSPAVTVGSTGKLSVAQMQNLHDNFGWQVASQAWTSEAQAFIDGLSVDSFVGELAKVRNWQRAIGVTGGEHGSYFSGVTATDMIAFPAFRKHFRSMRAYDGGNSSGDPLAFGEMWPWADPMRVASLAGDLYTGTDNATRIQAHIDQAVLNRGVAFITWHDITANANVQAGFSTVLSYLDSQRANIDVCTEADLAAGLA